MSTLTPATEESIRCQLKKMGGWCDPLKALRLAEFALAEKVQNAVEIGVFAGKSLLATAYGLKELGSGVVHGVDSWAIADNIIDSNEANTKWWSQSVDLEAIYAEFIGHLATTGLARHVHVWRCTSAQAAALLTAPIDLLHIDGCHSEWSSTSDVVLWLPKVRSGGIVCMDDYNWPETQTAVRFVRKWCDELETMNTNESVCAFFRKK